MAEEATSEMPRIEAPIGMDKDDEELVQFAEVAMDEIISHLRGNRDDAKRFTDVEHTVEEVLAVHNTRELDIRAKRLENPKVTLWLKDCPVWANDSWPTEIYPRGINAYNGDVAVLFDVRPF